MNNLITKSKCLGLGSRVWSHVKSCKLRIWYWFAHRTTSWKMSLTISACEWSETRPWMINGLRSTSINIDCTFISLWTIWRFKMSFLWSDVRVWWHCFKMMRLLHEGKLRLGMLHRERHTGIVCWHIWRHLHAYSRWSLDGLQLCYVRFCIFRNSSFDAWHCLNWNTLVIESVLQFHFGHTLTYLLRILLVSAQIGVANNNISNELNLPWYYLFIPFKNY